MHHGHWGSTVTSRSPPAAPSQSLLPNHVLAEDPGLFPLPPPSPSPSSRHRPSLATVSEDAKDNMDYTAGSGDDTASLPSLTGSPSRAVIG